MSPPLTVVRGQGCVILVAPHAGRRDVRRRPWGSAPLRMNDLHTGALTRELAARLDASAVINEAGDRNDVDLNRISQAHDAAPHFLDALAQIAEDALSRHPRLQLLTVHGWNVAQPAVDIGLGTQPSATALQGGHGTAFSETFAAEHLPRFASELAGRGIRTTPGLRYPARARENLLQLFTGRYHEDDRIAVRRLARLADRVDAIQLELGLPLRLLGPWRDEFLAACTSVFATGTTTPVRAAWPAWMAPTPDAPDRVALEFTAPGLCGLAAIDPHGGRLLLFPDDGRLYTFTGERAGVDRAHHVAGLGLQATAGRVDLTYDGPMLAFPDTRPFVDLEHGLAGARAVRARVALRFESSHAGTTGPCPFGRVQGRASIDGATHDVDGNGVHAERPVDMGAAPRAALRLLDGTLVITAGDEGLLCHQGRHQPLTRCALRHQDGTAQLTAHTADGSRIDATLSIVHRLPVVPGMPGATPTLFGACGHDAGLAGWIRVRSA